MVWTIMGYWVVIGAIGACVETMRFMATTRDEGSRFWDVVIIWFVMVVFAPVTIWFPAAWIAGICWGVVRRWSSVVKEFFDEGIKVVNGK